jgi:hypothetical protein
MEFGMRWLNEGKHKKQGIDIGSVKRIRRICPRKAF